MRDWHFRLIRELHESQTAHEVFDALTNAARDLGYAYCSYQMRSGWSDMGKQMYSFSNFPVHWQRTQNQTVRVQDDPVLAHCMRSREPIYWSTATYDQHVRMQATLAASNIRRGWSQSRLGPFGALGILSVATDDTETSSEQLSEQHDDLCWLMTAAKFGFSWVPASREDQALLSTREREVLTWTAQGKTSGEISDILDISAHTVNFHIKKASDKLDAANRTTAAVRAAMLGLLHNY